MKLNKGILLDIGCRDRKEANFFGLDNVKHNGVDKVWNLEKFPYPFEDESCLTIKCAHVIEHIKPWVVISFMNEMWRILKPNGQFAISAPYANSPGYLQDPTHCTMITEKTFQYFDPSYPLFNQYNPKPWKVEYSAYKPDANIEAILRKIFVTDVTRSSTLAIEATNRGAMQKPDELIMLFEFLKDKKLETIVEIGTARGGMLYALCQLASVNANIISIDLPGGTFGGGYTTKDISIFRQFVKSKQRLQFIMEDSHLESTKKSLDGLLDGRKIDLLFIDGDHTYKGVKKDYQMYSPLVKKDGIIVFHDICHHKTVPLCQVDKFWKEIKNNKKAYEMIDSKDPNWGGIGVIIR